MTDEQKPPGTDAESSASAPPPDDAADEDAAGTGKDTFADRAAAESAAAERDQLRDLLLRKTAELDNFRKRVERERSEFAQHAAEDLLLALLPLLDDLERALAAPVETPDGQAYRDGVVLIHRKMLETLRQRNVTPIDAVGEPFDPNLHEAVGHTPSEEHPDGTVASELRRGYRLGNRLLRAPLVMVAKGTEGAAAAAGPAPAGEAEPS